MATAIQLKDAIDRFVGTTEPNANALVNGGDTETVLINEVEVPTFSKAIKDFQDSGAVAIADIQEEFDDYLASLPVSNYAAETAPGVNDDSTQGYSVGSKWFDTVAKEAYVCADASVGAAVWLNATLTPEELGGAAFLNTGYEIGDVFAWEDDGAATPYLNATNGIIRALSIVPNHIADSLGQYVFDINSRVLKDGGSFDSIDLQNRQGVDSAATVAVDWETRRLRDAAGQTSVIWDARQLIDPSDSFSTLDWASCILNDSLGAGSIQWNSRQLLSPDGFSPAFDWSGLPSFPVGAAMGGSLAMGAQNIEAVGEIYGAYCHFDSIANQTGTGAPSFPQGANFSSTLNMGGSDLVNAASIAAAYMFYLPIPVAGLPTIEGAFSYVNDALAPVNGMAVAGGGSGKCLVCYNGTDSIVIAIL